MNFSDKTILITGGCSGIGKIMARKSLERGVKKLIILDVNESAFEDLKSEWLHFEKEIYTSQLDISNVESIKEISDRIKAEIGVPDILINNAGIVTGKYFHEQNHTEIKNVIDVNTKGMMHLTLEFLPNMMERNSGTIANICSLAGLISNPKMSVYAASKWASVGWSDSLRLEMKQLKKQVSVITMMPYYINTGMFNGVKSRLIPILEPEATSEKFLRAIEKNKPYITTPIPYWFIRFNQGILPLRVYEWIMDKVFGIYDTMEEFSGRNKKIIN